MCRRQQLPPIAQNNPRPPMGFTSLGKFTSLNASADYLLKNMFPIRNKYNVNQKIKHLKNKASVSKIIF